MAEIRRSVAKNNVAVFSEVVVWRSGEDVGQKMVAQARQEIQIILGISACFAKYHCASEDLLQSSKRTGCKLLRHNDGRMSEKKKVCAC
jgi:hypothetical protein